MIGSIFRQGEIIRYYTFKFYDVQLITLCDLVCFTDCPVDSIIGKRIHDSR